MKNTIYFLFILLISCSSVKIVSFSNEELLTEELKTYKNLFYKSADDNYTNRGSKFLEEIKSAIDKEMKLRGFMMSTGTTDLGLRIELASARGSDVSYDNSFFYGYSTINERRFTESILLLELIHARSKKIIWQASLDLKYYRSKKMSLEEMIIDSVSQLFETFPKGS